MTGREGRGAGSMIATRSRAAYLRLMVARPLTRIVAMLALLFASLGMVGGSAAANPAAASTASHHERVVDPASPCAEMSGQGHGQTDKTPRPGDCVSDCALGCAAIPPLDSRMIEQSIIAANLPPRLLADPLHGKSPGSLDPPPRTA